MDFSPIYKQFLYILWFVPFILLIGVMKTPWFKGVMGEFIVNLVLKIFLSKKKYFLIKDVTLPTKDGTTQIDHIVVSQFGVFVIETKNMKGWIFGSERQKQWTQKIYKHTSKFQNPLHQNFKHLKTLEQRVGLNPESLFSVIVFIGESTFKTEMPENVTNARGCIEFIKSKKHRYYSESQVDHIIHAIENIRLERTMATNRQHVSHVKKIIAAKQEK